MHDDLANGAAGALVAAVGDRELGILAWYRQQYERLQAARQPSEDADSRNVVSSRR